MKPREYRLKMIARGDAEERRRRGTVTKPRPLPVISTAAIARATGKTQLEIREARELALAIGRDPRFRLTIDQARERLARAGIV